MYLLGLQKNRSLVSLYDRTGVCTIRTLIKNDQNDLRTGTRAEFRPFSEALIAALQTLQYFYLRQISCNFMVPMGLEQCRETYFNIAILHLDCFIAVPLPMEVMRM